MNARALRILAGRQNPGRHLISSLAALLLLACCADTARATAIIFTNSSGGDWSVAANWSPNLVPGSGDDAYITNKTVTLDISPNVAGLTVTSSTLEGAGSLTVNGVFVWNSGTIENTGGLTLNGTSSLDGPGNGSLLLATPLTNAGALTWSGSGANLSFNDGQGTVTNLASGTITITTDVSTQPVGATIGNAGLLINTAGTVVVNATFVNTGTVQVQSGTLYLENGGTQAGALAISNGAALCFIYSTDTVLPGFSATGPGSLVISNGATVNFDEAGCTLPNLTFAGGTLGGTNGLAVNGPFVWSLGTMQNKGGVTLNGPSSIYDLLNGSTTLNGTVLTNAGALTWSGSGLSLSFGSSGGTLTNLVSGTITITADISTQGSGTIGNAGLFIKTNTTGATTLTPTFVNTGTLDIESGTVDLNSGGTQSGSVSVASGAALDFNGGTHTVLPGFSATGPGSFIIGTGFETAGTVNFDEAGCTMPNLTLSGGTLAGTNGMAVNGPFVWSNGTIESTGGVTLNGASSIYDVTSADTLLSGTRLTNAGALTWSGAGFSLDFASGGTLTNLATATINIITDFSTQGSGTIGNAGVITKTNTTGITDLTQTFVNTGTLNVQSGTVLLNDSSQESGIVNVASGAALYFEDSTHTVLPGFSAPGPGSLVIDGGTVNFDNPAGTTLPNLTFTNGTIGGSNTLTVNGPFVWSNGTMQNTGGVTLNGMSSIFDTSDGTVLNRTVLTNAGALTWSGGGFSLNFESGGILTNLATATINITSDFSTQGTGTIGNAGLITKTGGTGATVFDPYSTFVNTGTLSIQSGTLYLEYNSTEAGAVNIASGSTLYFESYTHTVLPGFSAAGPGSFVMDGGTVNFDDPGGATLPNLTFTSGTLGGSNGLAVNGPFVWSNGTMQNTGGVRLNGMSSIYDVTSADTLLSGTRLTNAGVLTWSGGGFSLDFSGGTLTNLATATINITTDFSTQGSGTIGNAGLVTKTTATGTTGLGQTFVNTGTLSVQSGTLYLGGSYALTNGTLNFGISGPTNYGKLELSGAMSSKCSLAANLNGFYWPPIGTSFNLLSYTSEIGAFFTNTALPAFITWQTNYNPTVFTLTVDARQTNTVPTNLTVSLSGNTNFNVAWPGDHTGWQLEVQTNSLEVGISTNWVIVPGSDLTNQMTFPIGLANSAAFFQLMYP